MARRHLRRALDIVCAACAGMRGAHTVDRSPATMRAADARWCVGDCARGAHGAPARRAAGRRAALDARCDAAGPAPLA